MATKDQMQEEQDNYGLAFNEPDAAPADVNEDEAFGLTPDSEEPAGESGDGNAPAVAIVIPEAPATEAAEPAAEEATETPAQESAETAPADNWEQKYKTLQGKYNAEIAAKKDEGSPAEEAGESPAEESGEGTPPLDEAIATLGRDFGDEFVKMIQVIARGEAQNAAGETVGEVGKTVEAIIEAMNDTNQREHFEKIYDAHPDFMEISKSPAFIEWISQNPEKQQTVESGSAREINALLTEFKASQQAPADEQTPPEGMDAAEGVRSTGLRIPEAPQQSDDFKSAWDEF